MSDPNAAQAAVAARIRALYAAGTPLFTRAALADLARVLDADGVRAGRRAATATVRGLDGRLVRLATAVGAVSDAVDVPPPLLLVNTHPQIEYWTIEKLTGRGRWHARRFDAARAFLPLRLGHRQEAQVRDAAAAPGGAVLGAGRGATAGELAGVLARLAGGLSLEEAWPPPAPPSPPVDTLLREQRAAWEASPACQQLRATLAAALPPATLAARMPVRTVVAFACGSMGADAAWRARDGSRQRHAVQHAMVLTVREVLEEMQGGAAAGTTVRCVAQDPAYDAADAAALAAVGISVVDDPHGFLAVDAASLVVAVAPGLPVAQVVADLARPAAMIWQRIPSEDKETQDDGFYHLGGAADPPSSPRVRAMVHQDDAYAAFPFPADARNFGTVGGLALYVRTARAPVEPPVAAAPSPSLLQRLQRGFATG